MIGSTILHYKILDKLGEGGMGVVYRPKENYYLHTIAVKIGIWKFLVSKEMG